jgi:aspartyl-tRNA(Asn)/glutamyl-tRNA(Gln) amidotransferase subunit C
MYRMTQISRDDVLHLAQLSSLELAEDEIDGLTTDIGNILGYVEQLGQLDTSGVEPTYQVTGLQSVWRDDQVINYGVTREELLARSKEVVDFQVKVPKVL